MTDLKPNSGGEYPDYPPPEEIMVAQSKKWDIIFEKRAHNILVIARFDNNPQGYITINELDRELWLKIGEKMLELQQI